MRLLETADASLATVTEREVDGLYVQLGEAVATFGVVSRRATALTQLLRWIYDVKLAEWTKGWKSA